MSCSPEIQGPLARRPPFALPVEPRREEAVGAAAFRLSLSPDAEPLARGGGALANPDVIAAIVVTISAGWRSTAHRDARDARSSAR
jgi:hypothetical protein